MGPPLVWSPIHRPTHCLPFLAHMTPLEVPPKYHRKPSRNNVAPLMIKLWPKDPSSSPHKDSAKLTAFS